MLFSVSWFTSSQWRTLVDALLSAYSGGVTNRVTDIQQTHLPSSVAPSYYRGCKAQTCIAQPPKCLGLEMCIRLYQAKLLKKVWRTRVRHQPSHGVLGFHATAFQSHVSYFTSVRRRLLWWQEQFPDPWMAATVLSMCSKEFNLAQKSSDLHPSFWEVILKTLNCHV